MTNALAPVNLDILGLSAPHTAADLCDCALAWRRMPTSMARAAAALRHVMLSSAQAVAEKHARLGGETAAQRAGRRDEEALQLLLHLHLLQLRSPDPAAPLHGACWRAVPASRMPPDLLTLSTHACSLLRSHTSGSLNRSRT